MLDIQFLVLVTFIVQGPAIPISAIATVLGIWWFNN